MRTAYIKCVSDRRIIVHVEDALNGNMYIEESADTPDAFLFKMFTMFRLIARRGYTIYDSLLVNNTCETYVIFKLVCLTIVAWDSDDSGIGCV